ncbi:hypothetical protein WN944_000550 [Citrus x changshan-huyou]|uniref:Serine hydroxymethyltransferase-like domain-containing protein n=1 Tax=Citrus x changshan-huyou TaxID=2935761 RepID=A0AAP0QQE9_9ROSI
MEAVGSGLIDKYSEGLPDTIVVTSTLMSLKPFVRKELWQHNFEVYTVILNPHDRITTVVFGYFIGSLGCDFCFSFMQGHARENGYPRMRQIAEAADAFLMMYMAHINRLVAASVVTDPFEYRGYINSRQGMGLSFESLRGPSGGMIFFRKDRHI